MRCPPVAIGSFVHQQTVVMLVSTKHEAGATHQDTVFDTEAGEMVAVLCEEGRRERWLDTRI